MEVSVIYSNFKLHDDIVTNWYRQLYKLQTLISVQIQNLPKYP